jgi:hypothetical protein
MDSNTCSTSTIQVQPPCKGKPDLVPNTVLMLRPIDFEFNEQTAGDNEFQHKILEDTVTQKAIREFDTFVEKLKAKGVNILVHDKTEYPELVKNKTPDSCFPNNWISTDTNGLIVLYPMYAPNRRLEKLALPAIEKLFVDNGYQVKGHYYIGTMCKSDVYLEGTGSMIIDRQNRTIYAAKSLRTDGELFQEYCDTIGYKAVAFDTESTNGKPYYHTNMIMCIGDGFILIASEGIKSSERAGVMDIINKSGKELIEVSREQAEKGCCGNILQVKSASDPSKKFIVMSERAFKGFTEEQKKKLEKHGEILHSNIDTIEEIGGGSARCMMCEVFLQKQ